MCGRMWDISSTRRSSVKPLTVPTTRSLSPSYAPSSREPGSALDTRRRNPPTTQHARDTTGYVPTVKRLERLREEACSCRNCDLWQNATQTVFGDGHPSADVMVVGEQPGDVEDKQGKPFVG